MNYRTPCFLVGAATIGAFMVTASASARPTATYKNAKAPVDARINDLLKRMTIDEKIVEITAVWDDKATIFDAQGEFDAKMPAVFSKGIGHFARPADASGPASCGGVRWRDTRGTIRLVNALQKYQVEKTRLGIPMIFHEEGLHGYAALGATSFPQAIALASSWYPDLVRARYRSTFAAS